MTSLFDLSGNYIWASLYQFGKTTKESYGRGLAIIDRMTNKVTPINDDRIPRTVLSIYFDGTNLWFGTESGLIKVSLFNNLAQWKSGANK